MTGIPRPFAVCAIVVTYDPDLEALGRLLAVTRPQVASLVVVDNGSRAPIAQRLPELAAAHGTELVALAANLGLAAAHNAGIAWARERASSHVLLLDQDSIPAPDMAHRLLAAAVELSGKGEKVAAVGPRCVDSRSAREAPFVRFGVFRNRHGRCASCAPGTCLPADFLISSGALIPMAVIDRVGGMEEGLFVDNIDMEWCFRAAAAGYRLYGVCDAVMSHRLGDEIMRFWLLGWRDYARHSPGRLYYMMRNRLLLYRKPHTPGRWILRDLLRLAGKLLLYAALVPPRRENARMMLIGLWHGATGRDGRYPRP
jgi:rhamnosyltransferase